MGIHWKDAPARPPCYDPDTFHLPYPHDLLRLRAGNPYDSFLTQTHDSYLQIVPYDIITDVTMTHADS